MTMLEALKIAEEHPGKGARPAGFIWTEEEYIYFQLREGKWVKSERTGVIMTPFLPAPEVLFAEWEVVDR